LTWLRAREIEGKIALQTQRAEQLRSQNKDASVPVRLISVLQVSLARAKTHAEYIEQRIADYNAASDKRTARTALINIAKTERLIADREAMELEFRGAPLSMSMHWSATLQRAWRVMHSDALFALGLFLNLLPPARHQEKSAFRVGVMSDLLMRVAVNGRVFGLNGGDWAMLLGSIALIGFMTLLI
jgi:hypothetical protein